MFVECVREVEEKYGYVHIGPQNALSLVDEEDAEDNNDAAAGEAKNNDDDDGEAEIQTIAKLLSRTSMSIPPSETAAGREMRTHLLKLRLRAVSRTREYFLSKFSELRRPRTNVRMIQVNALLRYADLNDFLLGSAPDVYAEVRDVYIESMGKTLHALFRTYAAQLARLDSRVASRNDLVALDDAALRDTFSTKVNMSKRTDAFHLGDRVAVLDPSDPRGRQPILAHVALAEGERYPYERLFKSVMTHLMDASTNEYVFVRQFFKENGGEAFGLIFSRTLGLVLEQLENYLFDCHDALAILLMIKLTHANRRTMRGRRVDALDGFFDRVANLLWPRLKMVVDAQIRSVRTANAKKLGGADLHPHVVGRRYAEFMSSCLLILNRGKRGAAGGKGGAGGGPPGGGAPGGAAEDDAVSVHSGYSAASSSVVHGKGNGNKQPAAAVVPAALTPTSRRGSAGDMLLTDLSLLTDETVRLLERLGDEHPTQKSRTVFLINNADQILCIFQERRVSSGREVQQFADVLRSQREMFVEEELLQGFSKMIAFVQQTEAHLARSGVGRGGYVAGGGMGGGDHSNTKVEAVNPAVVEGLVREFASSWKSNIESINRNVLSYFSNFRNGMEILKQVLTQLLLYYTRFQDIIRRVWRSKPPAFCKDLVSTTVILAEIKKYALAI
uniref:Vacuolar protein sorting-associated protein 52 homolog n=2 Tax=Odontella aurita TaxID=265563 RepID=A0A7S4J2A0_9STRA|mmetsp:Transcript_36327/g.108989  ORF Transcript_36327/g.108989 Transcript_36327/m.108989 type:complete len:671 (+) Transcript_36327:288-2300(+)